MQDRTPPENTPQDGCEQLLPPPENRGLVSVIVPVYNVERYLDECVRSILAQTYPYLELLLIDDGSTDASGRLCDQAAEADSRVRAIHVENAGPSAARNRGLREARGAYIAFVDSDDLVGEQMLEKMVLAITRYATDLAICGYDRFRDDWRQHFRLSPYSMVILQSRLELASVYNKPSTNMFGVSIWAKLYRADIIRANGIRFREDVNYEEDCLFNLDYFRHADTAAVLRDYFYCYRQMDVSLSKGYRKDSFPFLVNGYRSRLAFLEELGMSSGGAENIFMIVIKTTLLKIFQSALPRQEKHAEYRRIMSYPESQLVCQKAARSSSRLTRMLARGVLNGSEGQIHATLVLWQTVVKAKGLVKRILWRLKR